MTKYNQVTPEIAAQLQAIVGAKRFFAGDAVKDDFSHDEMPIYGKYYPEVVCEAESTEEVSAILRVCYDNNIPVTPRGAGTGLVGGCVPLCGGVVLCTTRMNKILSYDMNNLVVHIQPGVLLCDLAADALTHGLMYPPDPGEKTATVGGNVSTNAGGMRAVKYGVTRDYVLAMTVVLPDGRVMELGKTVCKTSSGYSLLHLMIGSEGTLGVITKAQIRIFDQPEDRRFRGFLFQDMHGAFQAARELLQKFKPSVMRLYDEAETATLIKKIVGVERKGAFMNVAYEGVKEMVDVEEKILLDTFKKYGAEDMGSEYGEKWWDEKITFFYPGHMMDIPQMFGTMDTIAPYGKIEEIYWAMKEAIETNFPQAKFIAHFSHWYEWGAMVYDRFIIDGKDVPQDPVEALRLHQAVWTCGVRTALAHGGVVNDHHGVGIKLGRLMKEQYGPAMQVFEGLKKTLDPNGIMNPFKLGL